jgi:hypothetical protein
MRFFSLWIVVFSVVLSLSHGAEASSVGIFRKVANWIEETVFSSGKHLPNDRSLNPVREESTVNDLILGHRIGNAGNKALDAGSMNAHGTSENVGCSNTSEPERTNEGSLSSRLKSGHVSPESGSDNFKPGEKLQVVSDCSTVLLGSFSKALPGRGEMETLPGQEPRYHLPEGGLDEEASPWEVPLSKAADTK